MNVGDDDELATLRSIIAARTPRLIGIDGMNGAGKTTRVAGKLGIAIVSTDNYLAGNRKYLEGLRYSDLAAALHANAQWQTIVEGCCLRAILERVDIKADLHVYVRTLVSGRWQDEEVCTGDDAEYALSREKQIAEAVNRPPPALALDLITYHANYRPFQNADVVVDLEF